MMKKYIIPVLFLVCNIISCSSPEKKKGLYFTILPASKTGIDFKNTIIENDSTNMFVNEYTYMGGGVGIGDFNNDGLKDIFFSGNQVSSNWYINKGNMHFEDITQKAGVSTIAWCTGVSVVDINNDGWPDIYISVSGRFPEAKERTCYLLISIILHLKKKRPNMGLLILHILPRLFFLIMIKMAGLICTCLIIP